MYKIRFTMPHGETITTQTYETVQEAHAFLLEVGFTRSGCAYSDGETMATIKEHIQACDIHDADVAYC